MDFRHYLGDVAILTKTGSLNDPTPGVKYTFRDRLGGISMLGDSSGTATEYRGYDAYGKPRNGNWTNKSTPIINSSVTDRGFTDHEHLDDWQLIHMNGRGYDYNLGRFLSVDPILQMPGDSQGINPYSYVLNNPLAGTDPTGYAACGSNIGEGTVCQITVTTKESVAGSRIKREVSKTYTVADNGAQTFITEGSDKNSFRRLELAMQGDSSSGGATNEIKAPTYKIGVRPRNSGACEDQGLLCEDRQFLYDPSEVPAWKKYVGDVIGSFSPTIKEGHPFEIGTKENPLTGATIAAPAQTKLDTFVGLVSFGVPISKPTAIAEASVWELGWSARGFAVESRLGGNLPPGFPRIDIFKGNVATSIKSIDLLALSYTRTSVLKSKIRNYVNQVAAFESKTFAGRDVQLDSQSIRELVLAIPSGSATTAQRATIRNISEYATNQGVRVKVVEIR